MAASDDSAPRDAGSAAAGRQTFPRRLRLVHARQYQAVYRTGRRRTVGPLTVYARPNELGHVRLGLSVGARVGGAVVRNRVKRRLRDAVRRLQHDLPGSYDLVIAVRRHEPLTLEDYERLLRQAAEELHRAWTKARRNSTPNAPDPPRPRGS